MLFNISKKITCKPMKIISKYNFFWQILKRSGHTPESYVTPQSRWLRSPSWSPFVTSSYSPYRDSYSRSLLSEPSLVGQLSTPFSLDSDVSKVRFVLGVTPLEPAPDLTPSTRIQLSPAQCHCADAQCWQLQLSSTVQTPSVDNSSSAPLCRRPVSTL